MAYTQQPTTFVSGTTVTSAWTNWINQKALEIRSVKDYGAVGDGITDDTAAFQAAINAGSVGGNTFIPAGTYIISNITIPAAHRLFGSGRHQTTLMVKTGTTGIVITDQGNAAKIILEDFAIYGQNNTSLTDLIKLGYTGQWGAEGYIKGLFLRDAPNAVGLNVNANVGFISLVSIWSCATSLKCLGNGNYVKDVVLYAPSVNAGYFAGTYVSGVEIEAPANTCIPIYMFRESWISDILISLASSSTLSHLIELDATVANWSLKNIQLNFGSSVTITNGNIKNNATGTFFGGNSTGGNTVGALGDFVTYVDARTNLSIKSQQFQSFTLRLTNTAGTIQHRITDANGGVLPTYSNKVVNASVTLANSPTGTDATTAFASGGKISTTITNGFILDTASQSASDSLINSTIIFNSSGTALTCSVIFQNINVNGVTRTRPLFTFYNATTGATVPINTTNLPAGKTIDVTFFGCLA